MAKRKVPKYGDFTDWLAAAREEARDQGFELEEHGAYDEDLALEAYHGGFTPRKYIYEGLELSEGGREDVADILREL